MSRKIKKKILFTPGPLTTSDKTKKSMFIDVGSRDIDFIKINKSIFLRILQLGNASNYVCVPIQGSGTFGLEATLSTLLNNKSKILIVSNGFYGNRLCDICKKIKKKFMFLKFSENELISKINTEKFLKKNKSITHLAFVHCETSSGILNNLEEISLLCKKYKIKLIIDAMSSFGGVKIDIKKNNLEALISSSNKCLEGVPGFSFCIIKRNSLLKCAKNANSLALDIYDQWRYFLKNNQWRFTPPTHSILALDSALDQLKKEGGLDKRFKRYKNNYLTLIKGMKKLGFDCYLDDLFHSPIIISFKIPNNPRFNFDFFYNYLSKLGFIIYSGKITTEPTFRIGCIGSINSKDIHILLNAIKKTLSRMKIKYL